MTPPLTAPTEILRAPSGTRAARLGVVAEQAGMFVAFASGLTLVIGSGPLFLTAALQVIGSYLGPIALLFA